MKCEKCNNILPDDSEFCQYCGNKISKHSSKNPTPRTRHFCSVCGGLIDDDTRRCTECGKQHFKGFSTKITVTIVLSILLIVSVVMSVILYIQNTNLSNIVEELETENQQYYDYWVESFEQIAFFDEFVVFVEDDGTNWYHKYECNRFTGDSFWAFNINAAEDKGYIACPYCH